VFAVWKPGYTVHRLQPVHHVDSILCGVLFAASPAGFTAVDTLAFGALGHMAGVGIVLGLRATGAI